MKETKALPQVVWTGRAVFGLFAVAAYSQIKLQTVDQRATVIKAKTAKHYDLHAPERARRGSILDADGKPLAQDEDSYALNVQFDKTPNTAAFFMGLGAATGIPASEFESLAASGADQCTWPEPLHITQYEAVKHLKEQWRADGVSMNPTGRRVYPLGDAASGVVGLVRERKAILGLEASQHPALDGHDGMNIGFTDRHGAFLPLRLEKGTTERRDGKDITLTIDSSLQAEAAQAIKESVVANKADNGAALVMDPSTGDLLAMANWPAYSPYRPDGSDGDLKQNGGYNPCYMARLEPGSTFKILTLAKALDSGKTHMGDVIHCPGEFHPTKKTRIRCDSHHGNRAHGDVTPLSAISRSCNVAAATWAMRVGRTDFMNYVQDLGLLDRVDLGLPGQIQGYYNENEPSKPLQLATIGFGQSITCTPVTLIGAFSMLANDGKRVTPRLIKRIGTREIPVPEGKPIIRRETAKEVLNCMEGVIESDSGTGKTLRIPGYRLGGKTGTAQKIGGGEGGYVSNFVGFVPADRPRAVILVMVNNPKGGKYYGATVAGPVFQRLARAVIRKYQLKPSDTAAFAKAETPATL